MWFCPLHIAASVHIHLILAANLDPTQCSSSRPPVLSITAMALENWAFVWMAFSRSNLSSTKDCQNLSQDIFPCELGSCTKFGIWQNSSSLFVEQNLRTPFSSHSAVLIGGSMYACPAITGHGSKCQNIIQFDQNSLVPPRVNQPTTTRGADAASNGRGTHTLPGYESTTGRDSSELIFDLVGDLEPTVPTVTRDRAGSKTQNARSGKVPENTSCETCATKLRTPSTTILGAVLIRNRNKLLLLRFVQHFTSRILQNKHTTSHTEVFAQDKVQDSRKDTDTHHGSHGRTYAQRYRNFTDRDPLIHVSSFDNDSTATSTIRGGAAIPRAPHRLPLFIVIPLPTTIFLCPSDPSSPRHMWMVRHKQ